MKRKSKNEHVNLKEGTNDEQVTDDEFEGNEECIYDAEEFNLNLTASETDSDDENELVSQEQIEAGKSKGEKVKEQILERYQGRQGKQLYLRFPHKVPDTQEELERKVEELTPLAVKVHKPRQRHVRFCLIDFATKDDRDTCLRKLKQSIKVGDLKKYVVSIPRTESSDFVKELAERKIKSIENKKAKKRLKKASKKSLKESNFTSTVIVFNWPKNTSTLQMRDLFPNAVDINVKPGKGKPNNAVAVTFPTTLDARNVIKKNISLEGHELVIKFDNKKFKKRSKSKNGSKIFCENNVLNDELEPVVKKVKKQHAIPHGESKTLENLPVPMQNLNKKEVKNIGKKKSRVATK